MGNTAALLLRLCVWIWECASIWKLDMSVVGPTKITTRAIFIKEIVFYVREIISFLQEKRNHFEGIPLKISHSDDCKIWIKYSKKLIKLISILKMKTSPHHLIYLNTCSKIISGIPQGSHLLTVRIFISYTSIFFKTISLNMVKKCYGEVKFRFKHTLKIFQKVSKNSIQFNSPNSTRFTFRNHPFSHLLSIYLVYSGKQQMWCLRYSFS